VDRKGVNLEEMDGYISPLILSEVQNILKDLLNRKKLVLIFLKFLCEETVSFKNEYT